MVHLNSLQLQLENLKVVFEDEIIKGADIDKIKVLYYQLKGLEKLIDERKAKLDGELK